MEKEDVGSTRLIMGIESVVHTICLNCSPRMQRESLCLSEEGKEKGQTMHFLGEFDKAVFWVQNPKHS